MNIPKKYWRLRVPSEHAYSEMIRTSTAVVPDPDFLEKIKRGHGLCLATYDYGTGSGLVKAVGIVTAISRDARTVAVTWKTTDISVTPNPQGGQQQWSGRPYFCFEKEVADRYRLAEVFAGAFAAETGDQ